MALSAAQISYKQALFYLLLALVHVEHLCERLADKNPYLEA
jgi:hypothetical protein